MKTTLTGGFLPKTGETAGDSGKNLVIFPILLLPPGEGAMEKRQVIDSRTIKSLINGHKTWYHQIEVAPGIVTPGVHRSRIQLKNLDAIGLPQDCAGLRVLDVGCRDGFFAFEMEKRGAEVIGIDYAQPDVTGFSIAAGIIGSRVTYLVRNVYNLSPEEYGLFDIVLFLGVLYHLRNPMLALDRVRSMTKPSGLLFAESQLSTHKAVNALDLPLWQFYPRDSLCGDPTNKWAPNRIGLRMAIEESQYEVLADAVHNGRGYVKARAITDSSLEFYRRLDASEGLWGK